MSPRKVIANVVGLAGCVAVAWSVHGLMLTGSCGGEGAPPCPPESVPYFVAILVGLPVAIIATITGGRLAFLGIFLAVGAGGIWAGLELPAGERTVPLVIGGIFLAVILLPVVLLPQLLLKRRKAGRLLTEGATGIATVVDIRDTGVTVNNDPRVVLTLRIEPEDGSPPFQGEKTILASRVELPYRGQRFPAWYDRADPRTFMLGTKVDADAAPEVRRLFALAAARDPGRHGVAADRVAADRFSDAVPTDAVPTDAVPADAVPFAGNAAPFAGGAVAVGGTGGTAAAAAAAAAADPLDRLAKLNDLRLSGALTEAEFQEQKARILRGA